MFDHKKSRVKPAVNKRVRSADSLKKSKKFVLIKKKLLGKNFHIVSKWTQIDNIVCPIEHTPDIYVRPIFRKSGFFINIEVLF